MKSENESYMFSHVWLFATLGTVARWALLFTQNYIECVLMNNFGSSSSYSALNKTLILVDF